VYCSEMEIRIERCGPESADFIHPDWNESSKKQTQLTDKTLY
jgi:hypothetical protein